MKHQLKAIKDQLANISALENTLPQLETQSIQEYTKKLEDARTIIKENLAELERKYKNDDAVKQLLADLKIGTSQLPGGDFLKATTLINKYQNYIVTEHQKLLKNINNFQSTIEEYKQFSSDKMRGLLLNYDDITKQYAFDKTQNQNNANFLNEIKTIFADTVAKEIGNKNTFNELYDIRISVSKAGDAKVGGKTLLEIYRQKVSGVFDDLLKSIPQPPKLADLNKLEDAYQKLGEIWAEHDKKVAFEQAKSKTLQLLEDGIVAQLGDDKISFREKISLALLFQQNQKQLPNKINTALLSEFNKEIKKLESEDISTILTHSHIGNIQAAISAFGFSEESLTTALNNLANKQNQERDFAGLFNSIMENKEISATEKLLQINLVVGNIQKIYKDVPLLVLQKYQEANQTLIKTMSSELNNFAKYLLNQLNPNEFEVKDDKGNNLFVKLFEKNNSKVQSSLNYSKGIQDVEQIVNQSLFLCPQKNIAIQLAKTWIEIATKCLASGNIAMAATISQSIVNSGLIPTSLEKAAELIGTYHAALNQNLATLLPGVNPKELLKTENVLDQDANVDFIAPHWSTYLQALIQDFSNSEKAGEITAMIAKNHFNHYKEKIKSAPDAYDIQNNLGLSSKMDLSDEKKAALEKSLLNKSVVSLPKSITSTDNTLSQSSSEIQQKVSALPTLKDGGLSARQPLVVLVNMTSLMWKDYWEIYQHILNTEETLKGKSEEERYNEAHKIAFSYCNLHTKATADAKEWLTKDECLAVIQEKTKAHLKSAGTTNFFSDIQQLETNFNADIKAKVKEKMPIFRFNNKKDWANYMELYENNLKGKDATQKTVRLAAHKSTCEAVGIDWTTYEKIFNPVDAAAFKASEIFYQEKTFYDETYRKKFNGDFSKAYIVHEESHKLKPDVAELEYTLNTGAFVQDFSNDALLAKLNEIKENVGNNNAIVNNYIESFTAIRNIAVEIEKISEADPFKKAEKIHEILMKNHNINAIANYAGLVSPFIAEISEALPPEMLKVGDELLKDMLSSPFQWVMRYKLVLDAILKKEEEIQVKDKAKIALRDNFQNAAETTNSIKAHLEMAEKLLQEKIVHEKTKLRLNSVGRAHIKKTKTHTLINEQLEALSIELKNYITAPIENKKDSLEKNMHAAMKIITEHFEKLSKKEHSSETTLANIEKLRNHFYALTKLAKDMKLTGLDFTGLKNKIETIDKEKLAAGQKTLLAEIDSGKIFDKYSSLPALSLEGLISKYSKDPQAENPGIKEKLTEHLNKLKEIYNKKVNDNIEKAQSLKDLSDLKKSLKNIDPAELKALETKAEKFFKAALDEKTSNYSSDDLAKTQKAHEIFKAILPQSALHKIFDQKKEEITKSLLVDFQKIVQNNDTPLREKVRLAFALQQVAPSPAPEDEVDIARAVIKKTMQKEIMQQMRLLDTADINLLKEDTLANLRLAVNLFVGVDILEKKFETLQTKIKEDEIIRLLTSFQDNRQLSAPEKLQQINCIIANVNDVFGSVSHNILSKHKEIYSSLISEISTALIENAQALLHQLDPAEFSKPYDKFLQASNTIGNNVSAVILQSRDMNAGILTAKAWIEIAAQCLEKGDIFSANTILGELRKSELKKITDIILTEPAGKYKEIVEKLELALGGNNFIHQRQCADFLSEQGQVVVPFMGIFATDITKATETSALNKNTKILEEVKKETQEKIETYQSKITGNPQLLPSKFFAEISNEAAFNTEYELNKKIPTMAKPIPITLIDAESPARINHIAQEAKSRISKKSSYIVDNKFNLIKAILNKTPEFEQWFARATEGARSAVNAIQRDDFKNKANAGDIQAVVEFLNKPENKNLREALPILEKNALKEFEDFRKNPDQAVKPAEEASSQRKRAIAKSLGKIPEALKRKSEPKPRQRSAATPSADAAAKARGQNTPSKTLADLKNSDFIWGFLDISPLHFIAYEGSQAAKEFYSTLNDICYLAHKIKDTIELSELMGTGNDQLAKNIADILKENSTTIPNFIKAFAALEKDKNYSAIIEKFAENLKSLSSNDPYPRFRHLRELAKQPAVFLAECEMLLPATSSIEMPPLPETPISLPEDMAKADIFTINEIKLKDEITPQEIKWIRAKKPEDIREFQAFNAIKNRVLRYAIIEHLEHFGERTSTDIVMPNDIDDIVRDINALQLSPGHAKEGYIAFLRLVKNIPGLNNLFSDFVAAVITNKPWFILLPLSLQLSQEQLAKEKNVDKLHEYEKEINTRKKEIALYISEINIALPFIQKIDEEKAQVLKEKMISLKEDLLSCDNKLEEIAAARQKLIDDINLKKASLPHYEAPTAGPTFLTVSKKDTNEIAQKLSPLERVWVLENNKTFNSYELSGKEMPVEIEDKPKIYEATNYLRYEPSIDTTPETNEIMLRKLVDRAFEKYNIKNMEDLNKLKIGKPGEPKEQIEYVRKYAEEKISKMKDTLSIELDHDSDNNEGILHKNDTPHN